MNLLEHPGPKGQIITAGRIDPFWFSSVRDTVAFTLMPDQPRDIRAIYVSDMARAPSWEAPGETNWVDARKAFFVIEGRKQGGMGAAEAVPFGNREAADGFAAANGGRVVTFTQIPRDYVLGSDAPSDQRQHERPDQDQLMRDRPMLTQNVTRRRMIAIPRARPDPFLPAAASRKPTHRCDGRDRRSARRSRSKFITPTAPRRNGWSNVVCWTCGGWSSSSACTARTRRSRRSTDRHSGCARHRHGGAAEDVTGFCRDHRRCVRSDGAAAVAASCRSFFVGEAWLATVLHRSHLAEALAKVGYSRPAGRRRPDCTEAPRRGHHAERHRAGLCHRPRCRAAAPGGPVDNAGQHGRDPGDRRKTRGHAVARRPRRSRTAGRADRNGRPCRPRRRDVGGCRFSL